MTRRIRTRRSTASSASPRASAARQALRLCETGMPGPAWDAADLPPAVNCHQIGQRHASSATTREALRAVGLPPSIAAVLCRRLRLVPEQEAKP